MGQESRSVRFTEALGKGVDDSVKKLVSEIMKDGALSARIRHSSGWLALSPLDVRAA